jgi:hypothetical protein
MFLVWLFVIFAIGVGIVMIFFRDLWWELTHWGNQAQGLASQRNDVWDSVTVLRGFLALGAGIILLLMAISAQANENARLSESATLTAQHRSVVDDLDRRLQPFLTEWRDLATEQLRYVEPDRSERLRDLHVFYGRCQRNTDFFVIVYAPVTGGLIFTRDVHVYAEGFVPSCLSSILRTYGEFERIRENWYLVSAFNRHDDLFTRTPTTAPTRTPTLVF